MDRREMLGLAGMAACGAAALGDDHGSGKMEGKFNAPIGALHLHFCGIHIAKANPKFQIVTQHYCGKAGESLHQCLLYDSAKKEAKLIGVEYIVPDEVFRKLPAEEQKYWHPHTYEVLGGGLIAPSMKPDDEMAFMKALLTTWGKTWHTWPDPTTAVPMGEPILMWSLTGDGQEDAKVIAARDKEFGVKTADIRARRIDAIGLEIPDVPLPKDLNTIGRQWTGTGEDKPTKRKK
jgi:hypothetical protein